MNLCYNQPFGHIIFQVVNVNNVVFLINKIRESYAQGLMDNRYVDRVDEKDNVNQLQ